MIHQTLALVAVCLLAASASASPAPSLELIAGSSRRIRMYVKNAYLRLTLNGTVCGAPDDQTSDTLLQRSSVTVGKVKIQGVTTCMYLCMDICGFPYASREFSEECVFNEMIEENHYNSYTSARYSNSRRTLYLGLNKKGQPRRVITRGGSLGRQWSYARVLTQTVPGAGWGRGSCPPAGPPRPPPSGPRPCRLRGRRRRRKRKRCREEDGACLRKRKSRLGAAHRIRHRKHRTAARLEEEEMEEEEEEVSMTTEEEGDEHTEPYLLDEE